MGTILFVQAAIVLCDIPGYAMTGMTWFSMAAILFGMASVILFGQKKSADFVDFPHLTERVMLYVVFSFGEMIIAIASYFEGKFSFSNVYFALMAFLIAVGLFLSYGVFYDHIVDREKRSNGLGYMLLHIFIIFALNNITNGLEFMREEEIELMPKMIFLIVSFIMFFTFLLGAGVRHAKATCRKYYRLCLYAAGISAVFAGLMIAFRFEMKINIALTVVYVFSLFSMVYRYGKKIEKYAV